ncbi:MAG: hypothetical protein IJA19_05730 [Clostridia bacterium]|nr:hypothetical protein [Clostridia bacterium]
MEMNFDKNVVITLKVDVSYARRMLACIGFKTFGKSDEEIINFAVSLLRAYGFQDVDKQITDNPPEE